MSDYVTLQELKNTLDAMQVNFFDYDAQMAISAASRSVDEYCGRRFFTEGTFTRYYTARNLGGYPYGGQGYVDIDDLVTASTVQTDWDGDGVLDTTWTQNTDYVLEPFNAASVSKPYEVLRVNPRSSLRFPVYPRGVAVTGGWGWPAVPAQVKEATTVLAIRFVRRAREASFGVVSVGIDGQAVHIPRMDPDVGMMLSPLVKGCVMAA